MFINDITIRNFRVYYGANQVRLAADNDRNITIISGNNGFGKTSFLTALVWCLYGKLMSDVDTKYRQEIHESGGYKAYCKKLMNRLAASEDPAGNGDLFVEGTDHNSFSVTITFSDILIPSVPCNLVQVKRTYLLKQQLEEVELLIDGKPNELTKQVGSEIFINDFILPKEIAKFFFFDAEKIVSLAEIKNSDEKIYLSQAYAEVLGIKKYADLRANLVNTRLRLREKSAEKSDRSKLERLQKQLQQNERQLEQARTDIQIGQDELLSRKSQSDNLQIQLIREGSNLSVEEVKSLKERQASLGSDLNKLRHQFNELLELAPFAIAGSKMIAVKNQLEQEFNNSSVSASLLENKFNEVKLSIESGRDLLGLAGSQEDALISLLKNVLLPGLQMEHKILLDFTTEQHNRFNAIVDNLQDAYSKAFKRLTMEQKRVQFLLTTIQRKLADAESKEKDVVIQGYRADKARVDAGITQLEEDLNNLEARIYSIQQENQVLARQLSELTKRVQMEQIDQQKDAVAERLIAKLDKFIHQLKTKKKESLERSLTDELNRLMHKDFVKEARVLVDGDLIDIELYDVHERQINKELLSKGEQQLYATALLKALVEESHIRFPIFIDSPLQKFDKTHAKNIIQQFYPAIQTQLILFPLLENELNEEEYRMLLPTVGKSYLIQQVEKYHSKFTKTNPEELFNHYHEAYVQ
ncbi:AAA family ATPase [Mucilaginibacter jinjuensis]|uniref:AAA family ATPase n=1 Tax=Mucilaginibacter jinjuensis TaxID=1176721 RepID=A0ABY7TAE2_9SPHI|nr:AAA family ATPase [Mucilaginibacter jinjuensis]WCT13470.1 AAA family ATPase [Mucilaginibacter jinjuensis]